MRAALLIEPGRPLEIEEVEPLAPGPHDAVVRVLATSLCQTDFGVRAGKHNSYGLPMIMGHEACGRVEAVGQAVTKVRVGDRVISSTAPNCGVCTSCTSGRPHMCALAFEVRKPHRARRKDGSLAFGLYGLGSFADQMTVHEAQLVAVEAAAPDTQLALIGCGVTTGLGAVLNRAELTPGASFAMIGCGAVGLAAIQGARMAGAATIIAVDPRAARRADALRMGATAAIDPGAEDVAEGVRALTGGAGADVCIDGVGAEETARTAFDSARPAGRIIIVGLPQTGAVLSFDAHRFFISEKRISSSLFGSADIRRDFPRFARFADEGKLDLGGLVTKLIRLEEVNEALDALAAGEVVRAVIVPN